MKDQEREDKYKRDRMKLRVMAEQLRKQKQDELVKLGQEIQFENHT